MLSFFLSDKHEFFFAVITLSMFVVAQLSYHLCMIAPGEVTWISVNRNSETV